MNFFPYEMLRRSWQYQLLTNLKKEIADTPENRKLIDTLFKEHPEGFHVRAEDTINIRGGNRHYVTMTVEGFISAVIDHIPDRQFRTIRHYGVYSRGLKRKFRKLLGMVGIAQQTLTKFMGPWAPT